MLGPRIVVFEAVILFVMLFSVDFIVLCALISLEYCVGSSDCGV